MAGGSPSFPSHQSPSRPHAPISASPPLPPSHSFSLLASSLFHLPPAPPRPLLPLQPAAPLPSTPHFPLPPLSWPRGGPVSAELRGGVSRSSPAPHPAPPKGPARSGSEGAAAERGTWSPAGPCPGPSCSASWPRCCCCCCSPAGARGEYPSRPPGQTKGRPGSGLAAAGGRGAGGRPGRSPRPVPTATPTPTPPGRALGGGSPGARHRGSRAHPGRGRASPRRRAAGRAAQEGVGTRRDLRWECRWGPRSPGEEGCAGGWCGPRSRSQLPPGSGTDLGSTPALLSAAPRAFSSPSPWES